MLKSLARTFHLAIKSAIYRKLSDHSSSSAIVENHFLYWSQPNHQNKNGLKVALMELSNKPAIIIETGTSAYGTDSTRLFDQYVRSFGGRLLSVDINSYPSTRLSHQMSKFTQLHVSDSIEFLSKLEVHGVIKVDLFYLDSWDVNWSEPEASARHGLAEYQAIRHFLLPGTVLVIDDTPNSMNWIPANCQESAQLFKNLYGVLPGKGALIPQALLEDGITTKTLFHDYNLVIKVVEAE